MRSREIQLQNIELHVMTKILFLEIILFEIPEDLDNYCHFIDIFDRDLIIYARTNIVRLLDKYKNLPGDIFFLFS